MTNYYPPANWEAPRDDGYRVYPPMPGDYQPAVVETPAGDRIWCRPEEVDDAIAYHKVGLCWECGDAPGTREHWLTRTAPLLVCDSCWADHEAQRDHEDTRRQPASLQ